MLNLFLDADDTLWENNIYFEQAIADFMDFLNHSTLSHEQVREVFNKVEHGKGYGSKRFTHSLLETYQVLAEREIRDDDLEQVRRLGYSIIEHDIELLPGVEVTLDYLAAKYTLTLLTKGDPEEQNYKVGKSGLDRYFSRVLVVPEKDQPLYQRLVEELPVKPSTTWMIGNSPKSDINPALAAGLNAAFIPHPNTWQLEQEEVLHNGNSRLLHLTRFTELKEHF
jgi:putative hydrolase of the HAD superfamily